MWLGLAGLLFVIWVISLALKVTVGAIHLLLVGAVLFAAIGFIRRHAPTLGSGSTRRPLSP